MFCPLNNNIDCPLEDVYGACFFCQKVNEDYVVSKIPVSEADLISFVGED